MIRNSLILSFAFLFMAACGGSDNGVSVDSPTAVDVPEVETEVRTSLFERIGADSIYVWANLEPLPEALSDKIWSAMQPIMQMNAAAYQGVEEAVEDRLAAALFRELYSIDSREALESRGLHGNGLWAVHALSMYPVVHWQLTDADAFSATIERIANDAGMELALRGIDEEELLWLDLGDFGIGIHHDERFVTLALVPDDMAMLRRVVNLDQPADAYDPRRLADFNRERGYAPQGSGYIDFVLLMDRLLDEDDELMRSAREEFDLSEIAGDPACQQELQALAANFPLSSFGYTRVSNDEISMSYLMETDRDLGQKLARIADAPVSLQGERAGVFSAGLSVNLVAARDFGREIVGRWVENPPQCQLFANIRENAEQWQLSLNQPIPPVVTNLHGFRINIDQLDLQGAGTQGMRDVRQVAGTFAIFMRNPQMMIGMAQMFSPDLAALDLRPGGDPQPVPPGLIPNMPNLPSWIAMGDNAIGLAFGEAQKDRLKPALESGSADSAILYYGIDAKAYAALMGDFAEQAFANIQAQDENFEAPPEGFFDTMAETYEYSEFSVHLEPGGIQFNSRVKLRD